jgi:hypothetical protein
MDARDARIAKLKAELAAALEREKRFGEIIAQQQTLIAAQQELIADLQEQLAAADAERAAAVARLEREVARLERELLGPKTERVKVPPIDRELLEEMSEKERGRRREEAAAKRREHALAKNAILETEDGDTRRSGRHVLSKVQRDEVSAPRLRDEPHLRVQAGSLRSTPSQAPEEGVLVR